MDNSIVIVYGFQQQRRLWHNDFICQAFILCSKIQQFLYHIKIIILLSICMALKQFLLGNATIFNPKTVLFRRHCSPHLDAATIICAATRYLVSIQKWHLAAQTGVLAFWQSST
jgi:hypothetical protein